MADRLDDLVVVGEEVSDFITGIRASDFEGVQTDISHTFDRYLQDLQADPPDPLAVLRARVVLSVRLHSLLGSYVAGDNSSARIRAMLVGAAEEMATTSACLNGRGSLSITTVTSGTGTDLNGYRLNVDDVLWEDIGINASLTIDDIPEGEHLVALEDIAPNCTLDGDNPRSVTVPSGGVGETTFALDCSDTRQLVSVAAGNTQTCALSAEGKAYCWGNASAGALGNGIIAGSFSTPDSVRGGHVFTSITAGSGHTCGLTVDSLAYCWGLNNWGQLGTGATSTNNPLPVPVTGGMKFSDLTAGDSHTCALGRDGEAYCWGNNVTGQLGDGTTTGRTSPVLVLGDRRFIRIDAGDQHTCAVTSNGTVYCWGNGASGRLGNGETGIRSQPVVVSGAHYFRLVSAGGHHTCGLADDSRIYCWGANSNGEVGDSSVTNRLVPTQVRGAYSFSSVFAGGWHSCGAATDGLAYCWGYNGSGELGNGTTSSSWVPAQVSGGLIFTVLNGHGYTGGHTCGVTTNGQGYCWGSGQYGKLGNGSTASSSIPVPIAELP
jgi:alpha-tubulin suppressor-like RCC1 family protein